MDNSVLMCNEIIEKTILMKKKKKKEFSKHNISICYLSFY